MNYNQGSMGRLSVLQHGDLPHQGVYMPYTSNKNTCNLKVYTCLIHPTKHL